MTQIKHDTVDGVVSVDLVDSLITQLQSTPMPRVRDAAMRQLYRIGITIDTVSKAIERDLEAGDRLLNKRTDDEQNTAPETQMWLEWLAVYETAQTQLQRVTEALRGIDGDAERSVA